MVAKKVYLVVGCIMATLASSVWAQGRTPPPPQPLLEMHDRILANPSLLDNLYNPRHPAPPPLAPQQPNNGRAPSPEPVVISVFSDNPNAELEESARLARLIDTHFGQLVEFRYYFVLKEARQPRNWRQWADKEAMPHLSERGLTFDFQAKTAQSYNIVLLPHSVVEYQGRFALVPLNEMPKTVVQVLQKIQQSR